MPNAPWVKPKMLREGDKEGALQKQSEALDNLRKGAQELAEQMREKARATG